MTRFFVVLEEENPLIPPITDLDSLLLVRLSGML